MTGCNIFVRKPRKGVVCGLRPRWDDSVETDPELDVRKCTAFIWLKTRFSSSQLLGRILSKGGVPSLSVIVIIRKTALFEPQLSLEDSARLVYSWLCKPLHVPIFKSLFSLHGCRELDHPVFTSFDFATVIFLQCKVVSLASSPPTWRTHRIAWLS
jgi:hypothetical protein